jgi:hypothetical protein
VKDSRKGTKVNGQGRNHARKTKDFEKQETGMTMRRPGDLSGAFRVWNGERKKVTHTQKAAQDVGTKHTRKTK